MIMFNILLVSLYGMVAFIAVKYTWRFIVTLVNRRVDRLCRTEKCPQFHQDFLLRLYLTGATTLTMGLAYGLMWMTQNLNSGLF